MSNDLKQQVDELTKQLADEKARVNEFRTTNVEEKKKNTDLTAQNEVLAKQVSDLTVKFNGIDPAEYHALKAKAASGDDGDVAALKATLARRDSELAAERAARAE